MWVAYCREELPTKAVFAWCNTEDGARSALCGNHDGLNPHNDDPDPLPEPYWEADSDVFELTQSEWDAVYVPGNSSQTSANIVANHGDKFV